MRWRPATVEAADLLLHQCGAHGDRQTVRDAVVLQGRGLLRRVFLQLTDARFEEFAGVATGSLLVVKVVGEIEIGDRVGDARCQRVVMRGDADADDTRMWMGVSVTWVRSVSTVSAIILSVALISNSGSWGSQRANDCRRLA